MNPLLKLIAFMFCLLPLAVMVTGMAAASISSPYSKPLRGQPIARSSSKEPSAARKVASFAPILLGEISAIILLIDAVTRRYTAPSGLPIALAVMGIITFGLTSVVYYIGWGWRPSAPEAAGAAGVGDLCPACVAGTLDVAAPSTGTFNFIGTRMIGAADRCQTCGSTIKTLWFVALLPLIPFGSYRILPAGGATVTTSYYSGRKTSLNLGQILLVYLVDLGIVATFAFLLTR